MEFLQACRLPKVEFNLVIKLIVIKLNEEQVQNQLNLIIIIVPFIKKKIKLNLVKKAS